METQNRPLVSFSSLLKDYEIIINFIDLSAKMVIMVDKLALA